MNIENAINTKPVAFLAKNIPLGAIIAKEIDGEFGWEVTGTNLDMDGNATITIETERQILTDSFPFNHIIEAYPEGSF